MFQTWFQYLTKCIHCQYSESFTRNLFMTSDIGPYTRMFLRNSLLEVFLDSQQNYNCFLTIGINTVAVFKNSEQTFDSHSRDLYGMPDSFGKCTLVCIEGLENVVSYFNIESATQEGSRVVQKMSYRLIDC